MKNFLVTLKSGTQLTIAAKSITVEWPGVRLLDEEGEIVAIWLDGSAVAVVPADAPGDRTGGDRRIIRRHFLPWVSAQGSLYRETEVLN